MRAALVRPRHNEHSGISVGAVVGIAVGVAAVVVLAAAAAYMFYRRLKRDKAMKRQSALDESVAMSVVPPPALNTRFTGRTYRPRNGPSASAPPQTRAAARTTSNTSPQSPEEARVWAEWLVQTAPKEPPATYHSPADVTYRPPPGMNSPWLEIEPSAPPAGDQSRITNIGSEDMLSPIELELAQDAQLQDAQLEEVQGDVRATSGPLEGPSAMPVSPPLGRTSLHPPPRMVSIKRKPIVREVSVARPPTIASEPTVSPPSASPQSSISNAASSRPPSIPYPDFNVPTSPDELFIPLSATPLGPILELSSPVRSIPGDPYSPAATSLREEDVPVLLARERVEMLREERVRLERIHELRRLEEQARKDLRDAQRSSLEAKRRSAEAQRRGSGGGGGGRIL